MRPFFELCTFFLLSVQFSFGWDQIVTPSFKQIFPKISDDKIWTLTFHVNRQKTTGDAKKYLNSWLDENWTTPSESIVTDSESIVTDSEVIVTSTENPRTSEDVDFEDEESSGDYEYSGDSEDVDYSGDSSGNFDDEYENSGSGDSEDVDVENSGDLDFEIFGNGSGDSWSFDFDNFEDSESSGDVDYEYSGSGDYVDPFAPKTFGNQIKDSEDVTSSENSKDSEKPKATTMHPFLAVWLANLNSSQAPPTFEENADNRSDTLDYENFLIESFFDENSTSSDSEKFKRFKRAGGWPVQQNWEAEWFKYDTTTPPPWQKRCLSDKEYARSQALSFLDHRDTLKMYIRYIFKMSQMDGLLTKTEAEKMREMFWENDKYYNNRFSNAEYGFLYDVIHFHGWNSPSSKIESSLRMYAAHWDKFPPIAEKLRWVVQEDYLCWYETVKYNW